MAVAGAVSGADLIQRDLDLPGGVRAVDEDVHPSRLDGGDEALEGEDRGGAAADDYFNSVLKKIKQPQ